MLEDRMAVYRFPFPKCCIDCPLCSDKCHCIVSNDVKMFTYDVTKERSLCCPLDYDDE